MADTVRIEMLAVEKVENIILKVGQTPEITTNDRTPLTDGYIFLYNESNKKSKETFMGKIPTQVKGTTSNKYGKYRVAKTTLNGYQKFGGILLFVAYVDSKNMEVKSLYYRVLTVLAIKRLLENFHNNKSKTISVNLFPENTEEILRVLYRAYDDIDRQNSKTKLNLSPGQKKVSAFLYGNETFEDVLGKQSLTLYEKQNNNYLPIGVIEPSDVNSITESCQVDITFEHLTNHFQSKIEFKKQTTIIYTGMDHKIKITMYKDSPKVKIDYQNSESLEKQKNNIRILISFLHTGYICINGKKHFFEFVKNDTPGLIALKNNLTRANEIIKKITTLQEETNLPFFEMGLSEKDQKKLQAIVNAYLSQKGPKRINMYEEKINNKFYRFIYIPQKQNEEPIMLGFFNKKILSHINYEYKKGRKIPLNPFTMGNHPIEEIGDFNSKLILDWYKENPISNHVERHFANQYSFKLIKAYNKTQNKDYLKLAIQIDKMIYLSDKNDDILFLNYVQSYRRLHRLNTLQITRLTNIARNNSPREQFAADLILKIDDKEIINLWNSLEYKEKVAFKELPIFDYARKSLRTKLNN